VYVLTVEVMARKDAGTVMGQVENGEKLKTNLNGRNARCAGETGAITVSTVAEQVLPN
jgi:hypothetical protein